MHLPRLALSLLLPLGLLACQNSENQCVAPASPAVFAMGTGETCFEPVATDQAVPLMNGPQGGFHIWLAVGCEDCGDQIHLQYGARDPATNMPLLGTSDTQEVAELKGDDWPQAAGMIVQMPGLDWDPESTPPPAKGSKMVLWTKASTAGGAELHKAEVEIVVGDTVRWDPCEKDPDNALCNSF